MSESNSTTFWVGLGASAGGLEALQEFVRNLEPNVDAVYIVLQHMSPQHKSLLKELIGRETLLDVVEITSGTTPRPNSIYISPPNSNVIVSDGQLCLLEPSKERGTPKPSVDLFFRSLADAVGDRAIGVVLSGTGADGALGVRAIRAAGGITIAQSEGSAKYNGMPQAAVDTGCVDLILSATEAGAGLASIVQMPRNLDGLAMSGPTAALSALFQALQMRTGVDFREYKPSTVRRRIERRLAALGIGSLDSYAAYVRENPDEALHLFKDMMISVTSFFRDPEEFEWLSTYLSDLTEANKDNGIRVWVPGCATGQEAYSLAMMIAEKLGGLPALERAQLQIFATDIDVDALTFARRGLFPQAVEHEIPPEYLQKYCVETDDGYLVHQSLRERIAFTQHNLCQDPPFSNIDLVSCRNLLIYFSDGLQSKVFSRIHYALKTSGILFLGKSEAINGSEALFRPVSEAGQVFRRRTYPDRKPAISNHMLGIAPKYTERAKSSTPERRDADVMGPMFHGLVRAIGPNGLLVTADLHIQRIYGNIDRYISLSEGQLRGATIGMLRDDLRHEVRMLIALALRNGEPRSGMKRRTDGVGSKWLQLNVYPIGSSASQDDMVLVIFRDWEEQVAAPDTDFPDLNDSIRTRISALEHELQGTRESLQQTVEELETANEELQSLNEEMQSANEELQSTNEELETTNEELQSTNEELITVNEELQINSYEMAESNQELDSVLSNIAVPVLVVDARLHIVQYSQRAREMFQITAAASKPHLSQLNLPLSFPSLTPLMADVIQTGAKAVLEIDIVGFLGSVTAAPYFSPRGELIGATAIVHEISDPRTKALEALLNNLPLMIWQKDEDDRIIDANLAAARFMQVAPGDARGKKLQDVIDRLPEAFVTTSVGMDGVNDDDSTIAGETAFQKYLVPYRGNGASDGIFVVATAANAVLPEPVGSAQSTDWSMSASDGRVTLTEDGAVMLGLDDTSTEVDRAGFLDRFHADDCKAISYGIDSALEQGVPFTVLTRTRSGQSDARLVVRGRAQRDSSGKISRVLGDLKEAQQSDGAWRELANTT